ncbi:hypothetical protein Clacol_006845 [Clathrus columnatus]|uniref:Uncharacterized protein n=1 Tax=Clathrus columnatus TaxID=1419009 RepID=A0AAV5AD81_9AGAM|nr:hypothetical protein Clacol_006845 [Clathrus columnatus]
MTGHGFPGRPPARAYDEYLKAYSVAMLPRKERTNVSYGGKTSLDLEGPWMFQLRNPNNAAASTHAGVLEFIADEGVMMKTLRLNEGDPVRITGAELAKGKRVKLQAQTVDFLEISDPKAVYVAKLFGTYLDTNRISDRLEQALRHFTCLTQGDMIEISYNSITFQILIMEILPEGPAISILDTDLEVDFAPPKGYVEPARPEPKPQSTMASKLKIDLNDTTPGSSRPGSSLSNVAVSKGGTDWEAFKGKGETLNGRRTKGRGISARKVEEAPTESKIYRTDKPRMVTTDELDQEVKVPAPLNLPPGKLFFGFPVVPYRPKPKPTDEEPSSSFGGSGNTLSSRTLSSPSSSKKGKEKAQDETPSTKPWGAGQTLGTRRPAASQSKAKPPPRQRSPTPDWGVDDDDVIVIDSD